MDIEYRKNVWKACMESKWRLNGFGNLVLHHLCCKDKGVAKMFCSDRFFPMPDKDDVSFNRFYEENCSEDLHLNEIKIKCDLLGIRLVDCEDLVGRYVEFAEKGDQEHFRKLMEFCGGEEMDRDRIIAVQTK